MNVVLTYRQQVHVVTVVLGIICSSNSLSGVTYCRVATFIYLLYEEMAQLRVFVCQIRYSLEIGSYNSFLICCQRIGYNVTTKFLVGIGPLIVVHVVIGLCLGNGLTLIGASHAACGSITEAPCLVSSGSAKHFNKGRLVGLKELRGVCLRIIEIVVTGAAGKGCAHQEGCCSHH